MQTKSREAFGSKMEYPDDEDVQEKLSLAFPLPPIISRRRS